MACSAAALRYDRNAAQTQTPPASIAKRKADGSEVPVAFGRPLMLRVRGVVVVVVVIALLSGVLLCQRRTCSADTCGACCCMRVMACGYAILMRSRVRKFATSFRLPVCVCAIRALAKLQFSGRRAHTNCVSNILHCRSKHIANIRVLVLHDQSQHVCVFVCVFVPFCNN